MTLLQKIHAVLLKSLWKRTCAVNRTSDYFHSSSTVRLCKVRQIFLIFEFCCKLWRSQRLKQENRVDPTSTETTYCCAWACPYTPEAQYYRDVLFKLAMKYLPVAPLCCDLGCCSRTFVVIKLLQTSTFWLLLMSMISALDCNLKWEPQMIFLPDDNNCSP